MERGLEERGVKGRRWGQAGGNGLKLGVGKGAGVDRMRLSSGKQ